VVKGIFWVYLVDGVSGRFRLVGLGGREAVAEGDCEGVQGGPPPHGPPCLTGYRKMVSATRAGLQGGCRERVERAYGLGQGEDVAVHQALVELVQVKQLWLLRVPGLQQVGGRGAQRDGAEPGRVQR